MGQVTRATAVTFDGGSLPLTDLDRALRGYEGGLVELGYAYGPALLPPPAPWPAGMWRYHDLLPLGPGAIRYPLSVGGTPLLAAPRLCDEAGIPGVVLKDETRSPTGSNKDRATALVIERALRSGATTITAASTGNVAVSTAVGAAAAGLRAMIFVPGTVGEGKLRLMLAAGATVFKVAEGYDAAYRLSRQAAAEFGWEDRNTGSNPLTVEAKKTVALEIWEQMGREAPDVVVVPVGDGTTLSAMWKGFQEIAACGGLERLPRLIAVQAQGCCPLHRAFAGDEPAPTPGFTIADGICVDNPINAVTTLRDVRTSGGGFVTISDEEIERAIQTLAGRGGILAEPAGAAAYAGLRPALSQGLIEPQERVVVLVTGSGLKTPQYLVPSGRVFEVQADVRQVAACTGS